ncbi:hypothetical protein WR164_06750 [Philodulcilactobacillus myokoensis]|uniref:YtxH domain-containing protein n=1 Tax=Philodulcilactobacillus myokoensis TaxID=2929573 RepID=A0A9W6B1A9_9LACO|nr:hypothetical protein [Philodulcilactobacillus myokoensis]GLB46696.1 hypothetical protein WR164_06750 [Philodulcilactobacillus myokoensis]
MNKKSKFLIGGMLFGGAAFAAFKQLDPKKRKQLINKTSSFANKLKKRAINYTLYVDDTVNHAKSNLDDKTRQARSKAKDAADKAAKQVKQTTNQVQDKVNNVYFKSSKNKQKDDENTTQFHTATDHLRTALNDPNQDDIVINGDMSVKQPTVIFYPDGSSKKK